MNWKDYTYYYFLGIGGIGMSAIARFLNHEKKIVLGYDKTNTPLTKNLEEEGIQVHYADQPESIPPYLTPQNTLVVITPAVPIDLKEYQYFKENGFTITKRSKLLGDITSDSFNLSVAGTHGKTTTSSMLAHILAHAGENIVGFLGGILEGYNSNLILTGDKYSVSEADEFDRSFLALNPEIACITSTDADHLDIYGDDSQVKESFKSFGKRVKKKLFTHYPTQIENATTYGFEPEADVQIIQNHIENGNFLFDLIINGQKHTGFAVPLPGKHNVLNATAAILMALETGVSIEKIKDALRTFQGIKRRFSQHKTPSGSIYIDDYAHHPTELDAAINAARELYPDKKILGVFQPHLFSRTKDFAEGFAKSLSMLDELILLDIYPAREKPIEGVTASWLFNKINMEHKSLCSLEQAMENILEKKIEVLMTLGAGNIDVLVEPLKKTLP